MAERGVYSAAEAKMLADFKRRSAELTGWIKEGLQKEFSFPAHRVASRELIEHMATAADFKNPLYRDESYARNTRWGGIIAPPFFYHCILHGGGIVFLQLPPEHGIVVNESVLMEHKSDFYQPIRVNDTFRIWYGPTLIDDITRPGKDSMRQFRLTRVISYINQRDEVVCTNTDKHIYTILPPSSDVGIQKSFVMETSEDHTSKRALSWTEEYVYSKEDIQTIDRLYDAEVRRGAEIRYWEDVNVGDELPPIVMGPLTTWDSVVSMQGFGVAAHTMNDLRKVNADTVIVDPSTNIPYQDIELHLSDRVAKLVNSYSTTLVGPPIFHFLSKVITNWAGDDGFLRRFSWHKLANTPFGDTIFGRGKVVRKYVENGEYLVDLDTSMESVRGFITNVGPATVSLLSREQVFNRNDPPLFRPAPAFPGAGAARGESVTAAERSQAGFKKGDRVKIKDRPDWPMPGGYKLANQAGRVVDTVDSLDGYLLVVLDEEVTGIDTKVPLGLKVDSIAKV
ncbi:FAS1-like dehydratase domain-containing protein [Paraburkholderia sp. HP33-1]|uniref:FAS1-like dehydratase domain-containing protein n=1 Tax=Paraburkholderia sp. HP33-1 TaxID=2883243 RepID=UPI001F1AFB02|nr:MaoC family dehydratase N-terminal domain-containing protein [Paraburkholderia sp. HP33-1]